MKDQGTGKMHLPLRGFVTLRFFAMYLTIANAKNIIRYTEDLSL